MRVVLCSSLLQVWFQSSSMDRKKRHKYFLVSLKHVRLSNVSVFSQDFVCFRNKKTHNPQTFM